MKIDKRALTVALVATAFLAGNAGAATIAGTVKYTGKVPKLKPLSMDADPACAEKHDKPVPNPVLVLGDGNTMGNIFVRVKSGLPEGKTYPAPKEAVVIDQLGCTYEPHVLGIQTGQPLKILNSDGILHNVHALPKENEEFNLAMPPSRTEATKSFEAEEFIFPVKCDVHPWMKAYVGVLPHPYFDVTEPDGKYTINGDLPAGTYEIEVWHEKLGTKTEKVTVGADETKTVDFEYAGPK